MANKVTPFGAEELPSRECFNQRVAEINMGLEEVAAAAKLLPYVCGQYTGTGTECATLTLDFAPSYVVIHSLEKAFSIHLMRGVAKAFVPSATQGYNNFSISWVANTVQYSPSPTYANVLNEATKTYRYIAFR